MSERWRTIVTTVENKPGVLARVASLFSRRGYNIHSLAVAPASDERFSRITFTVDVEGTPLDQVVKQLNKLINVVEIHELDPDQSVERELMLVTVRSDGRRRELMEIVEEFQAFVLNEGEECVMLSWSARPVRLDELEQRLRPFGIVELERTGRVALPSLDR
jgi:acetolactate synthase-1/3 small subunit